MKATTYRGLTVEPAPRAPEWMGPAAVPGWQSTCPKCGRSTWGSYATQVRSWITDHTRFPCVRER